MNVHIPDCYSVDDLLIFGDITHGIIGQGIEVSIPDQSNVEAEVLGALESVASFELGSGWREAPGLVLLIVALAVRPTGVFSKATIRKV